MYAPRKSANQVNKFGIGPTPEINLRVSVAHLVRVLFTHPTEQKKKLILERTATIHVDRGNQEITVKAKPFGGGVQINDTAALKTAVGEFRFDSISSHNESDFRIYIHPAAWDSLKNFCVHQIQFQEIALELTPRRELCEEFRDCLGINLLPDQYSLERSSIAVESLPVQTSNIRAAGNPTVRIYSVHEMWIHDQPLIRKVLENSASRSDHQLRRLAQEDYLAGNKGRANAALVLDYEHIIQTYRGRSDEQGSGIMQYRGHDLDGNVLAILEPVKANKYQQLHV